MSRQLDHAPAWTADHLMVLEAVCCLAPRPNVNAVIRVLIGLPEQEREKRHRVGGRMRTLPRSAVAALVGQSVQLGLLEYRNGRYRNEQGVGLTPLGHELLLTHGRTFRPHRVAPRPTPPQLLQALFDWREAEAAQRGMHPRRLLADRLLLRIASLQPYTWSDLLQLGPLRKRPQRLADWGESLLDVLFEAAPPRGGEFVPESADGMAVESSCTRALILDHYSEADEGFRSRTRVGDALGLYLSGRHDWLASVLARKLAGMYWLNCRDLPQPGLVVAVGEHDTLPGANARLAGALADIMDLPLCDVPLDAGQDGQEVKAHPDAHGRTVILVDCLTRAGKRLQQANQLARRMDAKATVALASAQTGGLGGEA